MQRLTYSNPNAFGQEGVDHINVSNQSTMQLGRLLSPSYMKVIDYPYIGKFASVSNLWYWLKTSPLDDGLRRITGARLKDRMIGLGTKNKVPNFKAIIGMATYLKLLEYPNCIDHLRRLSPEIPLIAYYTPKGTGVRMCCNYVVVVHEVCEVIRKAARHHVEPDFESLADHISEEDTQYAFLKPFLLHHFGVDRLHEFTQVA